MFEAALIFCTVFLTDGECPSYAAVIDLEGPYGSYEECRSRVTGMMWGLGTRAYQGVFHACRFTGQLGETERLLKEAGITEVSYCVKDLRNPCRIVSHR